MLTVQNGELREQVENGREELAATIAEHQDNLARLREEMVSKYYSNLEEQQYESMVSCGNNSTGSTNNKLVSLSRAE
jgi:molybdopterin converting factor small subunit